jgi:uncharacterized protein (DUF2147 family)
MMKNFRLAAPALLALSLALVTAPACAEEYIGTWLTQQADAHIRVAKCGKALCGTVTWLKDAVDAKTGKPPVDDKNPDPAKRTQPIVGLVIMENAKKSGNKWSGTLYNRENGKSYSGSITVKSKDAVDLSGCVAAVLCRTVTWTRIK